MNNKWLKRGGILLAILLVGFGAAVRYHQVNAATTETIRTMKIDRDQQVHFPGLDFSFSRLTARREHETYRVNATMTIQQTKPRRYGDRGPNRSFNENLRLVVPYSALAVAEITHLDGSPLQFSQLNNAKRNDFVLTFTVSAAQYEAGAGRPYILLMVPTVTGYTRVELPL
ncbi:hypothetical protein [Lacticaseibacillus mingshuiensis]|uniref:Uncharacterized protein n=1 Tax=Lacticaseibacillus mingshuiensis TaxID=2799574 RepID=A0ABW4CJ50_9LACO|nr:hypothetical protein [Lacticaseibacillus mingshuiensis]